MLERFFTSQSKARTMQLWMLLQTTKNGNTSVKDYFLKMRSFANQHSDVGQPLPDEE